MLIDNLVQYDEYRMPKDSTFLDNQENTEDFSNNLDWTKKVVFNEKNQKFI